MPSSVMLRHVVLVRTDISWQYVASISRVTRIGELGTLAVTSNRSLLPIHVTLKMEAICSSETLVLTRTKRLTSQKTPFFITSNSDLNRRDILIEVIRMYFDSEDEVDMFLRNVGSHTYYAALYPRWWKIS
jgi:hypothetical protein